MRVGGFNQCEFTASGKAVIADGVGLAAGPDLSVPGCANNRKQHRRAACPILCIPAPDIFVVRIQLFEADQLCPQCADDSFGSSAA
ncbi:hypothetical protein D3C86_2083730 [compost metagenome]